MNVDIHLLPPICLNGVVRESFTFTFLPVSQHFIYLGVRLFVVPVKTLQQHGLYGVD
jgi:hypothetical protein